MAMIGDSIKRTAAYQRLDGAAVNQAFVYTATEIKYIGKCTARFSRCNDIDDGSFAGTLDRAQAISHRPVIHRGKAVIGGIDIGWQHGQILRQRIVIVAVHLVGVIHI